MPLINEAMPNSLIVFVSRDIFINWRTAQRRGLIAKHQLLVIFAFAFWLGDFPVSFCCFWISVDALGWWWVGGWSFSVVVLYSLSLSYPCWWMGVQTKRVFVGLSLSVPLAR